MSQGGNLNGQTSNYYYLITPAISMGVKVFILSDKDNVSYNVAQNDTSYAWEIDADNHIKVICRANLFGACWIAFGT